MSSGSASGSLPGIARDRGGRRARRGSRPGAGLDDVALDRFPADGRTHWWSFRAPRSWTPIRARLEVGGSDPRAVVIDHGRQPFSVATHSAGTPPDGIAARLVVVHDAGGLELVSGAIAIVPRASFTGGALEARLARAGALGFATDGPCGLDATGREQPGRIELEPDTGLFAFSVTSHQVRLLEGWADEGATARADDRAGADGGDAGGDRDPRGSRRGARGLDDRASVPSATERQRQRVRRGGVDRRRRRPRILLGERSHVGTDRTIRFVWAPEFVGTAAALTPTSGSGGRPRCRPPRSTWTWSERIKRHAADRFSSSGTRARPSRSRRSPIRWSAGSSRSTAARPGTGARCRSSAARTMRSSSIDGSTARSLPCVTLPTASTTRPPTRPTRCRRPR